MDISEVLNKLKSNKFVAELLTDEGLEQFKRYVITGFTTFILEYLLFYLFYEIVFTIFTPVGYNLAKRLFFVDKLTYKCLVANTIGYTIDFCVNFTMNRVYSFKSKGPLWEQVKKYAILFVVNLFVTNILLYLFTDILHIIPYISKLMAMCVIISWNFVVYKKVIYR